MAKRDASYDAIYDSEVTNPWHFWSGGGRRQFVVSRRFEEYLAEDPEEASRIPILQTSSRYRQNKYTAVDSPIPFLTWQEMQLIRAEVAVRSNAPGTALEFINTIRKFYRLSVISEDPTLDDVLVERDKELFCTGLRLVDQRRTGSWHLPLGTWQYIPISQRERDSNANL